MVRDYGPLVHLRLALQHAFIVADPQAVHDALVTRHRDYRKEKRKNAVRKMAGNGIIASEGDFWLGQRRIMQQGFAPGRFAHYAEVIPLRSRSERFLSMLISPSVWDRIDVSASIWQCHQRDDYYDVVVDEQVNEQAAWYYAEPKQEAENIKGFVAFWKGVEIK